MPVNLSVWICVAISPNVCISFHIVRMNHHVDWVELASLCYKLDSARYLVIFISHVCVSCLRALHELHEHIQRDSCVTERALSLLWNCLAFSPALSRVKKTALSHVTSHFQSGLGSKAAEEHPARRATMPTFSLWALLALWALGKPSGKVQECRDVCPRLWLHMMGGRHFI